MIGGISWDGPDLCHKILLQRSRELQGNPDVSGLRALVAASQQDDQCRAPLDEIDPIAGPVIDPELRYAFTDRPDITWVAERQSINPYLNPRSRSPVPQCLKPDCERLGLANFKHMHIVSYGRQIVNTDPPNNSSFCPWSEA
jgi:hypothetical protein